MLDHIKTSQRGQVSSINDLAADFVSRTIECERTYLTSLWLDPFAGNNAACDAGLRGSDFLLPAHAFVFGYICTCAEGERSPTVVECISIARCVGVQLDADRPFPYTDGRLFVYCDILAPHLDEVREGCCLFYAQGVKDYADQRREAAAAFRKFVHVLDVPRTTRVCHAA